MGQGTHSAGQGLTVTAAPTSDRHSFRASQVYVGRAPTVPAKGYLCRLRLPQDRGSLPPSGAAGSGAHSAGFGQLCRQLASLFPSFVRLLLVSLLVPYCRPLTDGDRHLFLSSSHVGPVRASAQPVRTLAGRRSARLPGLQGGGRGNGGCDQHTRRHARPALPRSQAVENALRTGVLGGVSAYGLSRRRSSVWGHTASLWTTRALESLGLP